MDDLKKRLRDIEGFSAPDLWQQIERREVRPRRGEPSPLRRTLVAAFALTVAAVAVAFAIRAFSTDSGSRPSTPGPSLASEVTPREVTTFRVGPAGQTNAIVAAAGSLWVTEYGAAGGAGVDHTALVRIDPTHERAQQTYPVGTVPGGETGGQGVVSAFGSVWIAGSGVRDGVLQRVDPATGKVISSIRLAGSGSDVAANGAGVWVAVSGAASGHADVVLVDPDTDTVVDRIVLRERFATQIVANEVAVMVYERTSSSCGQFASIDPATRSIVAERALAGACSARLVEWQGRIWASIGGRFLPLDPWTIRPAGRGFAYASGKSPRGFLLPDETGIWYGAYTPPNGNAPDRLTRLDPDTGAIKGYMALTHTAISAVTLDRSLWTLNYDGTITQFALEPAAPHGFRATGSPPPSGEHCPTPSGPVGISVRPTAGSPGSTIHVSGNTPLFNEAGRYLGPSGRIGFWFNLPPNAWENLYGGTPVMPSAYQGSPVVHLGEANVQGQCSYDVTFTVPDVAPGTYPLVPIQHGHGSSSAFATIDFRVVT